jgi:hypothetical protein
VHDSGAGGGVDEGEGSAATVMPVFS